MPSQTSRRKKFNMSNLIFALRNPYSLFGQITKFGVRANQILHRNFVNHEGDDFLAESWDTLIILDGCREDLLSDDDLPGKIQKRKSPASQSIEFMREHFDRELHDTVYVTANPYAQSEIKDCFYATDFVFLDDWNEEFGTVLPETMRKRAEAAIEKFPNKRIIIHFMQPHFPFIGPTGKKIRQKGIELQNTNRDLQDVSDIDIWNRLQYRLAKTDLETVKKAYRENLEITLDEINTLIEYDTGKTVVTSDHGNLLGERLWPIPVKSYGHPRNLYVNSLVEVPWVVFENGARPTIQKEEPIEYTNQTPDGMAKNQLQDLGYAK